MITTAAVLGLGAYILFADMPHSFRELCFKYGWAVHVVVFVVMFVLHGSTGEGAAMAGIAVVVFRFLMGAAERRAAVKAIREKRVKIADEADPTPMSPVGVLFVCFVIVILWSM